MKDDKIKIIQNESDKVEENETIINLVIKQLASPLDCFDCFFNLILMIKNNAKGFYDLPGEERVAVLTNRIHYLDMIESIHKLNVKGILKKQLKYEEKCLKKKRNSETGIYHLLTPDEILQNMKFNKMPIHGKMVDFGHKIGFIIYNLKNSNGNHYFDIETVIVARWVCALFIQSNGEPLVLKTMQEYIADGRKMKLDDLLEGLF